MGTHTTFYRGKQLYVQLRDGTSFVDRWAKDGSRGGSKRYAVFLRHGKIAMRDIRAITIYRRGVVDD